MNEESKQPIIDPELEARIIALVLGEASDFEREEINRLIETRPELATFKLRMQHAHGLLKKVGQGEFESPDQAWQLPFEKRNAVLAVIRGEATVQTAISKEGPSAVQSKNVARRWKWNFGHVAVAICVLGFMGLLAIPSLQYGEFAANEYFPEAKKDEALEPQVVLAESSGFQNQQTDTFSSFFRQQSGVKEPESKQPVSLLTTPNRRSSALALSAIQDSLGFGVNSTSSESNSVAPLSAPQDDQLDLRGPVDVKAMEDLGVVMLRGNEADVGKVEATIQELERQGRSTDLGIQQPDFLSFNSQGDVDFYLPDDTSIVAGRSESKQPARTAGEGYSSSTDERWFLNAPTAASTETQQALEAPQLIAQNDATWRFEVDQQRDFAEGGRRFRFGRNSDPDFRLQEAVPSFTEKIESLGELSELNRFDSKDVSGPSPSDSFGNDGLSIADTPDESVRMIMGEANQRRNVIATPSNSVLNTDPPASADSRVIAGFDGRNNDLHSDDGDGIQFNNFNQAAPTVIVGEIADGKLIQDNGDDGIAITATGTTMPAGPTFGFTAPESPNSLFDIDPLSVQNLYLFGSNNSPVDNTIGGERDGIQIGNGVNDLNQSGPVMLDDSAANDRRSKLNIPDGGSLLNGGIQLPSSERNQSGGQTIDSSSLATEQLIRSKREETRNQSELPVWQAPALPWDKDIDAKTDTTRRYFEQLSKTDAVEAEQLEAALWDESRYSRLILREDSQSLKRLQTNRIAASPGLNEIAVKENAFSTFSLHVSDVSFKLAMAALGQAQWPEAAKIRIEEFVNAFDYGDPMPRTGEKVACAVEQSIHPFLQQRNLLRISMKTAAAGRASSTPLRLTLLLDNSGSMERIDRQQTIRKAFKLLANQLTDKDQVTLISFARQPRLLADSFSGAEADKLVEVIYNLPSEGGTNIEAALQLAFEKAKEHQTPDAQNRIILLTDGAVNLGNANPESLSQVISAMRTSGIAFDAAGIRADGLNDEVLEALTRKGDGRYYLLDSLETADDGFAQQIAGALRPSAKNVKVQVEFNPKRVVRYKLLGFEKHILKKEDFRNDKVDAAEMAAAEAGVAMYQFEAKPDGEGDVGSVSVRFQDLSTGEMVERRWPIPYQPNAVRIDQAAPSLRTAASAALLAAKLKGEPLGESVDLKHLSQLMSGLPESALADTQVQQLRTMIEQARQLNGK